MHRESTSHKRGPPSATYSSSPSLLSLLFAPMVYDDHAAPAQYRYAAVAAAGGVMDPALARSLARPATERRARFTMNRRTDEH